MYIYPNTNIYILKDIPLDLTYEHTIYCSTKNSQVAYFSSKAKYKFSEQSYQVVNRGVIRVEVNAENLYDCNYIMFQNSAYGSKWFYAFITGIDYINNNTAEIRYTLDILQTWHFEYTLQECFIEREHTITDNYGEHLVDEGLDTGELIDGYYFRGEGWDEYSICVVSAFDPDGVKDNDFSTAVGGFYSYIYSGFEISVFNCQSATLVSDLQTFLNKVNESGRTSSVLLVFMCPTFMVQSKAPEFVYRLSEPKGRVIDVPMHYGGTFSYANKNGYYKPKNNKLYNYPYSSLMVTNGDGDAHIYRWENFIPRVGNNVAFYESFVFGASPVASTFPYDYAQSEAYRAAVKNDAKAVTFHMPSNTDEALIMNDFVMCAYAVDSYRAWLAQKKAVLPYEIAGQYVANTPLRANTNQAIQSAQGQTSGLVPYGQTAMRSAVNIKTVGAAALAAGGAQLAVNTAGFVLNQLGQFASAKLLPEGINGVLPGNGYSTSLRTKRFTYTHRQIKAEFAEIIDNFFTMFGYKTNRMGTPNRTARPHWNYIKTMNCHITGTIPSDDARAICEIYNRGVTWWLYPDEVGDYSANNSPRKE